MQEFANIFQSVVLAVCVVSLAVLCIGCLLYLARDGVEQLLRSVGRHPWGALIMAPCVCVLIVHGSTKQEATPTVRGITLGSPMETPSSVALEWRVDEGLEIKSNQLVRVYWRDAYNKTWTLAAEGYGITNAVIRGFFINRDTDWKVEIEGEDDDDGEGDE